MMTLVSYKCDKQYRSHLDSSTSTKDDNIDTENIGLCLSISSHFKYVLLTVLLCKYINLIGKSCNLTSKYSNLEAVDKKQHMVILLIYGGKMHKSQ